MSFQVWDNVKGDSLFQADNYSACERMVNTLPMLDDGEGGPRFIVADAGGESGWTPNSQGFEPNEIIVETAEPARNPHLAK